MTRGFQATSSRLALEKSGRQSRIVTELCSLASLDQQEPLIGSASVGDRYVLVSRPKGAWAVKALMVDEFAELRAFRAQYDDTHGGTTVIRLFAGVEAAPGTVEVRVFPGGVLFRDLPLPELPRVLASTFSGLKEGQTPAGSEPCPRTIAVCTHGKHDRCCAQFGQALFKELRAAQAELGAAVVESSHLGGHRFAATLLDLPPSGPGRMYGRLRADETPSFVAHLKAGSVWLDRYRGRVDLGAEAQIAEAQALRLGAPPDLSVEDLGSNRYLATWAGGSLEVGTRAASFTGIKACLDETKTWSRPVLSADG